MVRVVRNTRGCGEGYTAFVHIDIPGRAKPFRKSKTLRTRAMAQAWGDALEREVYQQLAAGTFAQEPPQVPTLAEFAPAFIERHARAQNLKPSYVASLEDIFRVHLIPAFGARRLDAIDDRAVQDFKLATTRVQKKTLNNILSPLRKALEMAVEWRYIDAVPCRIRQVKVAPREMEFHDFEPYERLVAEAQKHGPIPHLIVLLAGEAGLRLGELRALRWTNVDFTREQITVCESDWDGHVGPTKGWHIRHVPFTDRLAAALRAQRATTSSAWVVHNARGEALTENAARSRLRKPAAAAGVKVGVQVLRHSFVSHLAMKGGHFAIVQRLVGHKNVSTTLRYTHLAPHALRDTIKLLNPPAPAAPTAGSNGRATAEGLTP